MTLPQLTNPTHLGNRIRGWVDDAGWGRPGVDWVAQRLDPPVVRPMVSRAAPAVGDAPTLTTATVVIPCYNYARFLGPAVASALDQPGCQVEVVIVDDASTDATPRVAAELASDPRVRVLRNANNLGHVATFNRGLAEARGELLVRLDADDLLTPGSLSRAAAVFETCPQVGLVYGHPRHFTSADPPPARIGRPTWTIWEGRDWVRERCRRGVNCITTPEVVFRSSVVKAVGPLDETLRFAQDMEFCLRVASVSDVARIDDVDQALHRDHDTSMSVTVGAGVVVDLVERRQVFSRLFAAVGERFPDRAQLDRVWRCTLAAEALDQASRALDRGRAEDEDLAALHEFAVSTIPADLRERELARWRELQGRRDALPRAGTTVRVVRQRLREEVAHLRWARTGI
jgi:glycosyltransferase involved in cell wall biosynthesis